MPKGIRKGKSPQKYKADYTEKDFYKYYFNTYCKRDKKILDNQYNVGKDIYYKIIKEFNKYVLNQMIYHNEDFLFPNYIGGIGLRKRKPKTKIDSDGKLISHKPIDWDTTLKLWEEDEDAKNKKILIRHMNNHSDGYVFEVKYIRGRALFKGARWYDFIPTRTTKLTIRDEVFKGNIDAILVKSYEQV